MKLLLAIYFCLQIISCTYDYVEPQNKILFLNSYYSSGQLKALIGINEDSIRSGPTMFFSKSGLLDSLHNYEDGKLNGMSFYFGKDRKIEYYFSDDSLEYFKIFDTLGNLIYQEPIDVGLLQKPSIKLLSNRSYLKGGTVDTIKVSMPGVPVNNRATSWIGMNVKHIKDTTYQVSINKKLFKEGKRPKILFCYVNEIGGRFNCWDSIEIRTE